MDIFNLLRNVTSGREKQEVAISAAQQEQADLKAGFGAIGRKSRTWVGHGLDRGQQTEAKPCLEANPTCPDTQENSQ